MRDGVAGVEAEDGEGDEAVEGCRGADVDGAVDGDESCGEQGGGRGGLQCWVDAGEERAVGEAVVAG